MRPETPGLTYVFTVEAEIASPRPAGPGLGGERLHIPILGGRVEGPRLSGSVLPGGSDWALRRTDGATEVQASYSIEASDRTLIWVRNRGLRVSTPEALADLRAGRPVLPGAVYFRGAPRFDVPDGLHQWMRERLFVCSLLPRETSIRIDVYMVE